MRSAILASALAAIAIAAPVKRQAADGGPGDIVVLNYALTLEHLENAFYQEVLSRFTLEDFQAVGLDNVFYTNLQTIASDEATHVEFLAGQLGDAAVVANEYDFGLTDVTSFLTVANILEGVGVSAYLGAAKFIADPTYLTAAGGILTVEARHSAYLLDSNRPQQYSPFPSAFDKPLTINQVYTLAAPFITQNNNPNANLPVTAFPSLSYADGPAAIGSDISVTAAEGAEMAAAAYFVTITGYVEAPVSSTGGGIYTVTIPEGTPAGQSYLILTSGGEPTDDNTVAGPAVVYIQDAQFGIVRDSPCDGGSNGGSKDGSYGAPSYGGESKDGSKTDGSSAPVYPVDGSKTDGSSAPVYSADGSKTDGHAAPVYTTADGTKVVEEDCTEEQKKAGAAHY